MYIVLNKKLKWYKSRYVIAEVGHAVQAMTEIMLSSLLKDKYERWKRIGSPKQVLRASASIMQQLHTLYPESSILLRNTHSKKLKREMITCLVIAPQNEGIYELLNLKPFIIYGY